MGQGRAGPSATFTRLKFVNNLFSRSQSAPTNSLRMRCAAFPKSWARLPYLQAQESEATEATNLLEPKYRNGCEASEACEVCVTADGPKQAEGAAFSGLHETVFAAGAGQGRAEQSLISARWRPRPP